MSTMPDADVSTPVRSPEDLTVHVIHLNLIHESPTNPRKTIGDLTELTASIRRSGVLQPVLVRPFGDTDEYELVYGHRRYRAAREAGLAEIPANVRSLTDLEVLEIQLVENSQRQDINALEEADGYRRLRDEHGLSADAIAERVGKSKATVYSRLKLCALEDKDARAALLTGALEASVGLLISRLPSKDQAKATKMILSGDTGDDYEKKGEPLSYREAHELLMDRFYLRPADAPFDAGDASLVKAAGPCTKCPKRVDVAGLPIVGQKIGKEDLCDDQACWSKKEEAARAEKLDAERAKGVRVLTAAENRKLFNDWGDFEPRTSDGHAFALLDQRPDYDDTGSYSYERRTWDQIAIEATKKDAAPLEAYRKLVVAALDGKGKVVYLFDRKATLKVAKAAGVIKKQSESSSSSSGSSYDYKKPTKKAAIAGKANAGLLDRFLEAFQEKAKVSPELDAKLIRYLLSVDYPARDVDPKKFDLPSSPTLEALGKIDANRLRAYAVSTAIAKDLRADYATQLEANQQGVKDLPKSLIAAGKLFGVDVEAVKKKVTDEITAAIAAVDAKKSAARGKELGLAADAHVELMDRLAKKRKKKPLPPKRTVKNPFKKIAAEGRKAVAKIKKASAKSKSSGSSKKSAAKK